jgi:hypothetical protein
MLPFTSPRNDVMMYRLQLDQETVLVLHNFSNSLITLNHEINEASLIEGEGLNENTIELSPYGSMVLSIESNITSLTL